MRDREIYLNRIKDTEKRDHRRQELIQSDIKVGKMLTRLRVHFDDLGLEQSMDALGYMCEKHNGTYRENGTLYIMHPLSMACRFQSLKIPNDDLFATILLHDVIEETAKPDKVLLASKVAENAEDLPVGPTVKAAVKLLTVSAIHQNETKSDITKRYFSQLVADNKPENKIALKCKGFDRWDNLATITALSKHAVRKNILETAILLLPVMEEARSKWPHDANIIYLLQTAVQETNNILAFYNGIENLYDIAELEKLLDDPKYRIDLR